jgi:hypothetical protein
MGTLIYDGECVEFEDRVLLHLQALIAIRLRRREPFLLSWHPADAFPAARMSMWIDNALPMRFRFGSAATGPLNDGWLTQMNDQASRAAGLLVAPEPVGAVPPSRRGVQVSA